MTEDDANKDELTRLRAENEALRKKVRELEREMYPEDEPDEDDFPEDDDEP